jgi:hypothetical protein
MTTTAKEIRKLVRERRAAKATTIPSSTLPCAIRLLSDGEIDEARFASIAWLEAECKRRSIDVVHAMHVDPDLFEREKIRQMLHRAYAQPVVHPDADPVPLYPGVDTVRELDAVLIAELFEGYLDLQEVRTAKRSLDDAGAEALVARLTGDDADEILSSLDAGSLRRTVRLLAARLAAKGG